MVSCKKHNPGYVWLILCKCYWYLRCHIKKRFMLKHFFFFTIIFQSQFIRVTFLSSSFHSPDVPMKPTGPCFMLQGHCSLGFSWKLADLCWSNLARSYWTSNPSVSMGEGMSTCTFSYESIPLWGLLVSTCGAEVSTMKVSVNSGTNLPTIHPAVFSWKLQHSDVKAVLICQC